jgi:hypothetical protein
VLKQLYEISVTVYPYIHMSWEGSMLIYQTAYMLGKISCHSPLLHLSGTRLSHAEEEEEEESDRLSFSDEWASLRSVFWFHLLYDVYMSTDVLIV